MEGTSKFREWIISLAVKNGLKREEAIAVLDEQGLSGRGLAHRVIAARQVESGVLKARKAVASEGFGDFIATGQTSKLGRALRALGTPEDVVDIDMKAAKVAADAADTMDFSSEAE